MARQGKREEGQRITLDSTVRIMAGPFEWFDFLGRRARVVKVGRVYAVIEFADGKRYRWPLRDLESINGAIDKAGSLSTGLAAAWALGKTFGNTKARL